MRDFIMTGLAALLIIKIGEQYLLPAVPDQTLVTLPLLGAVTTDHVALAAAFGAAGGTVESFLRGLA